MPEERLPDENNVFAFAPESYEEEYVRSYQTSQRQAAALVAGPAVGLMVVSGISLALYSFGIAIDDDDLGARFAVADAP